MDFFILMLMILVIVDIDYKIGTSFFLFSFLDFDWFASKKFEQISLVRTCFRFYIATIFQSFSVECFMELFSKATDVIFLF